MNKGKKTRQNGYTLVECMIALVTVTVGLSAIISLMVICLKQEKFSRAMASANFYSRSKMEELQNSTRTLGGSLTANTANFFDEPFPGYTRRWQITADTFGTQTVTVLMVPIEPGAPLAEVRLTTRMR